MSTQEIAKGVYVIKPNERKKWQDSNAGKYVSLFTKNRAEQWELSLKQATEDIKSAQERYAIEMDLYKSRLSQLDKEAADIQQSFLDANLTTQKVNAELRQRAAESTAQLRQKADEYRADRQVRLGIEEDRRETKAAKAQTSSNYAKGLMKAETDRLTSLKQEYRQKEKQFKLEEDEQFPVVLTPAQKAAVKAEYDTTLGMEPTSSAPADAVSDAQAEAYMLENSTMESPITLEEARDALSDLLSYKTPPGGRRQSYIRGDAAEGISAGPIRPAQISGLTQKDKDALLKGLEARRAELVAPTAPAPNLIGQARAIFGSNFGGRVSTGTLADQLLALPPELRVALLKRYQASVAAPVSAPEVAVTPTAPTPAPTPAPRARPAISVTDSMLPEKTPDMTAAARLPFSDKTPQTPGLRKIPEIQPVVQNAMERKDAEEKKKQVDYLGQRTKAGIDLARNTDLLAREIVKPGGPAASRLWTAGRKNNQTYDDLYRHITESIKDPEQRNRAHEIIIALNELEKKPPTGE